MLPQLNCIVVKNNRYHWCASVFWSGLEQHFTLVEVNPSRDRFSKVKGYDIMMKMDNLKLITILSRDEIMSLKYEKTITILHEWKMGISDKMNLEIIKKELEYAKDKRA